METFGKNDRANQYILEAEDSSVPDSMAIKSPDNIESREQKVGRQSSGKRTASSSKKKSDCYNHYQSSSKNRVGRPPVVGSGHATSQQNGFTEEPLSSNRNGGLSYTSGIEAQRKKLADLRNQVGMV